MQTESDPSAPRPMAQIVRVAVIVVTVALFVGSTLNAVTGQRDLAVLFALATPLGGLIPEPIVCARGANERCVTLPARAGEVVLLHNHVWHRSLVNRTGKPRRAFSVCYMSAATRCLRRKRAPREFFRVF